jgi:hypothetical protein
MGTPLTFEGLFEEPVHDEPQEDDVLIRPSSVTSMGLCPARVGYSLTEGYNPLPSEAMSFGTLEHAILERRLTGDPFVMSRQTVGDLWRELIRDENGIELDELAPRDLIDSSVDEAIAAAFLWEEDVLPQLGEPVIVEEVLWRPLGVLPDGRAVWLHGTPDLVTEGPLGHDWKTAGTGWKESRRLFEAQPSAYPWLAAPRLGVEAHEIAFVFWVYDRKNSEWQPHKTSRTRAEIDSWLKVAWMRGKQIAYGAFPATTYDSQWGNYSRGWWCSPRFCAAWDICQFKHLADDVDETETIEKGWQK